MRKAYILQGAVARISFKVSQKNDRTTGPGTKSSNYLQSFRSGTLSTCIWDSWLLVGLVISGVFVLNFQFNFLNPSLS